MSFQFTMTNLEVSKAELILPNVVTLYREEAVERVHVLPIAPRLLPSLRRTVNGGKNVFIKNMNNVVAYYETAVKRLDSSGHVQEAKDLEDRRLRLKAMIDGLNFNMIAVFILMDQRLSTLDEDARYAVIGRLPAFEATMAEQLPAASGTQEQETEGEQEAEGVPIAPQYPPTPSSTAEIPIAECFDEPDSTTIEDLENQVQNNMEAPPVFKATEYEAEKHQASKGSSEQVFSPLDQDSHDSCIDRNEPAMSGETGGLEQTAPLISSESSINNTLEPTPQTSTELTPEELNSGNNTERTLKRSFGDMDEQESEEESLDDEVEYEEVTDDEDEVIIITEEPEEEAPLPLPETTTFYDQTPQDSNEGDSSSPTVQMEESQDDNVDHVEVADEEEETIIITEEPEEGEAPLSDPEISTFHEQAEQQDNGSESPSSTRQENNADADNNEYPSLSIQPEPEFSNKGILQHLAEDDRQDPEETTGNNDGFLPQVETPAQLHDAPESVSSVSPISKHVLDYLPEESLYEWGSSLSQEDQDFLDDFHAAEEFLASSSDEECDAYPVKVVVVPFSVTAENTQHAETILDQDSVSSQAAEEAPSSEESTLLNKDEMLEEEKTENGEATDKNEEANAAAGASDEAAETGFAEVAETAETDETVPVVEGKLESSDETEDQQDTTPAHVPTIDSEEAVDSSEPPQWSLRGILGTVTAIGIPMAILYPTFTAVVLFGMIRYARSRR